MRARGSALALVAAAAIAVSSVPAPAQELADSAPSSWYGWQILLIDGASVGLVYVGINNGAGIESAIASSILYLGGGPVVHALHDRGITAGEDFLLRLALPSTMALIGAAGAWAASGGCVPHGCTLSPALGAGGGALFGMAASSILDVFVLADAPRASHDASSAGLRLRATPVGIAGSF